MSNNNNHKRVNNDSSKRSKKNSISSSVRRVGFEINFVDPEKQQNAPPMSPIPSPDVGPPQRKRRQESMESDIEYNNPSSSSNLLAPFRIPPQHLVAVSSTTSSTVLSKKLSRTFSDPGVTFRDDLEANYHHLNHADDNRNNERTGLLSLSHRHHSKKPNTTPRSSNSYLSFDVSDDGSDDAVGDDGSDDGNTEFAVLSMLEVLEDNTKEVIENLQEAVEEAREEFVEHQHYDWREHWKGGNIFRFIRWLATGAVAADVNKQSDDEIQEQLCDLARMLLLLREYHDRFGLPEQGGPKDQEYVLREVAKDLYLGGSPIWALEPVMKKVAEGLTGKRGVDFFMLPRRVFIFAPSSGATTMFDYTRGYDMQRLDGMETIAVRLASFASNTSSVGSVPARWPKPQELRSAFRTESLAESALSKEELAEEILTLASESEGLFFFINAYHQHGKAGRDSPMIPQIIKDGKTSELGEFWTVEDSTRELFCRLAAIDAAKAIDKMDAERKPLYSSKMIILFRLGSSAGACAFWFNGSWIDIAVSGMLAVLVAQIGAWQVLSKQERIIVEAVASLVVGLISGVISLQWPEYTCFGAMAMSGILDLLQGFRVVYSIIEIMSRHTVSGGADFLEGFFFTTLIAYFLRFGLYLAVQIMGSPESDDYLVCNRGVNKYFYIFFVPFAAICWSGLFNPHYYDLPFMMAHGVLGYLVSWQFQTAGINTNFNNFLAAMVVTFSAGVLSRFTGRQALGNTVAGIYVLLPGAYLITSVYSDNIEGFLTQIILRAIIIGIGAWTGTILCSPTLLGINRGLMQHSSGMPALISGNSQEASVMSGGSIGSGTNFKRRKGRAGVRNNGTGPILFF